MKYNKVKISNKLDNKASCQLSIDGLIIDVKERMYGEKNDKNKYLIHINDPLAMPEIDYFIYTLYSSHIKSDYLPCKGQKVKGKCYVGIGTPESKFSECNTSSLFITKLKYIE